MSGLDIGRRVKAKRIAAAIRSLGGTAADARKLSDAEWILADKLSRRQTGRGYGVADKPPSEVTRALVIEYLSRPDDAPRDSEVPPARADYR